MKSLSPFCFAVTCFQTTDAFVAKYLSSALWLKLPSHKGWQTDISPAILKLCCHLQKTDWKLFLLHTFKSSWWMTCSVLSPAIWNHRIMSIAISQKHIFILIFHYSVSRIVSPKFSLALSAANDGTLSKFKSHYSSVLFLFPSILFLLVFLYWKITILNYIVKKAIRNVLPFPNGFRHQWSQTKIHAFNQIFAFPTESKVSAGNTYSFCPTKTRHCNYSWDLANNITCCYNEKFYIPKLTSLYFKYQSPSWDHNTCRHVIYK